MSKNQIGAWLWWQQQIELFGEFILWIVSISSILMPKIRAYKFDVPKKNEETEIIRLLAKEQQSKEVAEKVLEQIDLIKKPFSDVPSAASLAPMISARRAQWSC